MKPAANTPSKFVLTVAKAIKNLKEVDGSTPKHIFGQVVSDFIVQNRLPHPRTIALSIQKSLRKGLKNGMFVKENGRFKLVQAPRRRLRSQSRRRTGRKNQRTRKTVLKKEDTSSESNVEQQSGEPMDRSRRRRRRRTRRRRPTRRVVNSQESNDNSDGEENKAKEDFEDDKLDMMDNMPQQRRSTSRHSCKEPQIK